MHLKIPPGFSPAQRRSIEIGEAKADETLRDTLERALAKAGWRSLHPDTRLKAAMGYVVAVWTICSEQALRAERAGQSPDGGWGHVMDSLSATLAHVAYERARLDTIPVYPKGYRETEWKEVVRRHLADARRRYLAERAQIPDHEASTARAPGAYTAPAADDEEPQRPSAVTAEILAQDGADDQHRSRAAATSTETLRERAEWIDTVVNDLGISRHRLAVLAGCSHHTIAKIFNQEPVSDTTIRKVQKTAQSERVKAENTRGA